jgi:hypothetical protein
MRFLLVLGLVVSAAATIVAAAAASTATRYDSAVRQILAEPYQPNYILQGFDTAFGGASVLDNAPAQDYTSGSIAGSPDASP